MHRTPWKRSKNECADQHHASPPASPPHQRAGAVGRVRLNDARGLSRQWPADDADGGERRGKREWTAFDRVARSQHSSVCCTNRIASIPDRPAAMANGHKSRRFRPVPKALRGLSGISEYRGYGHGVWKSRLQDVAEGCWRQPRKPGSFFRTTSLAILINSPTTFGTSTASSANLTPRKAQIGKTIWKSNAD
jgi:hypothetical protein